MAGKNTHHTRRRMILPRHTLRRLLRQHCVYKLPPKEATGWSTLPSHPHQAQAQHQSFSVVKVQCWALHSVWTAWQVCATTSGSAHRSRCIGPRPGRHRLRSCLGRHRHQSLSRRRRRRRRRRSPRGACLREAGQLSCAVGPITVRGNDALCSARQPTCLCAPASVTALL